MRVPAMRTLENALRRVGFANVAGVDEVGRGCLAGPVVAAAVVLHPEKHIPGVCDSKAVQAPERERLYESILKHAVAWAVAEADPAEIDRINIHQASLRAMQRATRVTDSIATKATRPPIIWTPLRALATPTCTVDRSALQRCLIRLTE